MVAKDPAGHFVVVGDNRNPATQGFDVNVAERFLNLGVKEQIGAAINVGH